MTTQIAPLNETINEEKRRRGGLNRIGNQQQTAAIPAKEDLKPWKAKIDYIQSVDLFHDETGQWYERINGGENPYPAFDTLVWVWLRWRAAERKVRKLEEELARLEREAYKGDL